MKRIFAVKLSKTGWPNDTMRFEVVADNAEQAIVKSRRQARRERKYRGPWVVEELYHRGRAV
jgi:hypothetical protein